MGLLLGFNPGGLPRCISRSGVVLDLLSVVSVGILTSSPLFPAPTATNGKAGTNELDCSPLADAGTCEWDVMMTVKRRQMATNRRGLNENELTQGG